MRNRRVLNPRRKEVLTRCKLLPKSNREKMLLTLLPRLNRPLPAEVLSKTIYGSPKKIAPLKMVAVGLADKVRRSRTGLALKRERIGGKVHYGLFAARR